MRSFDTSTRVHPTRWHAASVGIHRTFTIGPQRIHGRAWLRHARYHVWKLATAIVLAFGGWAG
jgi:hypothetical protein